MNAEHWGGVISRITRSDAQNVDDIAGAWDPRCNPTGRAIFPEGASLAPEGMPFKSEAMSAIGFRMTEPRKDIIQVAMQLATLAMENEVEVVIFNHLDYCGLERFGFRCERITGDSADAIELCEEQVRRYWNIDLIL